MHNKRAHYTVRVGEQICEQIALGKTLKQALAEVGYLAPHITTIWRWLDVHPDFRERYDRARQVQADMHADQMLEYSQEAIKNPKAAAAYKVAVDVLRWQAEVRNRGKYGQKADDAGKSKQLDPTKLRSEIKRLEAELGVAETKVVPLKAAK